MWAELGLVFRTQQQKELSNGQSLTKMVQVKSSPNGTVTSLTTTIMKIVPCCQRMEYGMTSLAANREPSSVNSVSCDLF